MPGFPEHTLFFHDPPYWKIPEKHDYEEQDFHDLAKILAVKGHFLMTIKDTPEVREIFSRFIIEEVNLTILDEQKGGE